MFEEFINKFLDFFWVLMVGIVGNIVIIVFIVVKKKIWKLFFVCIVNFVFVDMICLLIYLKLIKFDLIFFIDLCLYYWVEKIMVILWKLVKCLVFLVVFNMGIVWFFLFVYFLKSWVYLIRKKILIFCGVSVFLSVGYGYFVNYLVNNIIGIMFYVVSVFFEVCFFIMIVVILIIFFYKRLMMVRRLILV